ncbi:MAG TPA: hypothetical protein VMS17_14095 [Gemmataceae bacterium]|nr:hypothetical protein [Gemmataceae bacterium]
MQRQSRITRAFAVAAMTGLVAGSATSLIGCKSDNSSQPGVSASGGGDNTATLAKHDCKGQNSCKGQGGCKAGDAGCKGKNSCKGKGGCNTNKPME